MIKKNFRKIIYIIVVLIIFVSNIKLVRAYDYTQSCTKEAAIELAKIVYNEQGASYKNDEDNAFLIQVSTASVVINNANRTSKSSGANSSDWYDKIYGLSDYCYHGHSNYRDEGIDFIPEYLQGKMLYIAELVLTGQYTFPTNMTIQGAPDYPDYVRNYATETDGWHIFENTGYYDTMIAYEIGLSATGKDQFGNVLSDTSFEYYQKLAKSYMLPDYSGYNVDNVCTDIGGTDDVKYYSIDYVLNGGTVVGNPPAALYDEVITINHPSKNITVVGNDNNSDAVIRDSVSVDMIFKGWKSSNIDKSTAYYGNTAWTDYNIFVTETTFKNLSSTKGARVTLEAYWEDIEVNLPTVTKDDYTCTWNTEEDGSGESYESGGKYTVKGNATGVNVYAICVENDKTDEEIGDPDSIPTGDALIYIVWAIGIGALGYAAYYFINRKNDL